MFTVAEYISKALNGEYDLKAFYDYIDTSYKPTDLTTRDKALALYYESFDAKALQLVTAQLKEDYGIRNNLNITHHFLARCITRFKEKYADPIFWYIADLAKHTKKLKSSKPRVTLRGSLLCITYDIPTDSLISVCYPSAIHEILKEEKKKFCGRGGRMH